MDSSASTQHLLVERLDATVVDELFEAGPINTARLIIKNPSNVSIEILDILPPKGSTLKDPEILQRLVEEQTRGGHIAKGIGMLSQMLPGFLRGSLFGNTAVLFGEIISTAARTIIPSKYDLTLERLPPEQNMVESDEAVRLPKRFTPVVIAPHCETVQYIPFKTSGWLLFKPTKLNISVQLRYRAYIKNRTDADAFSDDRTQIVSASLDVRPTLTSMIAGGLFGAVLGTLARIFSQPVNPNYRVWFVTMFSAIVMSLIATILLSRKTGTQGFITVEDFFGAFVIGAIIGYTGTSYFNSIIDQQKNAAPGH
jgi:hypothetical protein